MTDLIKRTEMVELNGDWRITMSTCLITEDFLSDILDRIPTKEARTEIMDRIRRETSLVHSQITIASIHEETIPQDDFEDWVLDQLTHELARQIMTFYKNR